MNEYTANPWQAIALAKAALDRTVEELQGVLTVLATSMNPFPNFLGLATLQAVEVYPGFSINPDRGCVVVGPDGAFYELILRAIPGPLEIGDVDQVEELKELELGPQEYIPYAYEAIQELAKLHQERNKGCII